MAAALLSLLLALPASSAKLAEAAKISLGLEALVVGQKAGAAQAKLSCKDSKVQRTVKKCEVKPEALASARSLGNALEKATLVEHFQGDVVSYSVVYAPGLSFSFVLGLYKSAIGEEPKIEYWADDDHLYASYIWVDGEAEVELTDALKGGKAPGGVTAYVASLTRNRPLSPDDAK